MSEYSPLHCTLAVVCHTSRRLCLSADIVDHQTVTWQSAAACSDHCRLSSCRISSRRDASCSTLIIVVTPVWHQVPSVQHCTADTVAILQHCRHQTEPRSTDNIEHKSKDIKIRHNQCSLILSCWMCLANPPFVNAVPDYAENVIDLYKCCNSCICCSVQCSYCSNNVCSGE